MTKTLVVPLLALALAGCTIHQTKSEDTGKTDKVDIRTPMGSLKVRSTDVDPKDTGLSVYPGAQRVPETSDENSHSANVNIDTPLFQLKVVAIKFTATDPPAMVPDLPRSHARVAARPNEWRSDALYGYRGRRCAVRRSESVRAQSWIPAQNRFP